MKIVYCIGSLIKPGGAERVLITKANYLAEVYNYSVTILIASQKQKPFSYPVSHKVTCVNMAIENYIPNKVIPFFSFFNNIRILKKVYTTKINSINPDFIIVVERGYDDFIIPSLKMKAIKIRESHSSFQAVKLMDKKNSSYLMKFINTYYTALYSWQMDKYDLVVLLTKKDLLIRSYLKRKVFIPNTISTQNETNYVAKSKKVISVGRLDQFKNFKDQILVWHNIINIHPDWTLHIYGEGIERKNLEYLIKKLNLQSHVFLEGVSRELHTKYDESSFFIFTSLAEGFGMVLVEAMQFGLPVISYDCPCGPSEIIDNDINGFLIPVSDLDKLENSILKLIENDSLREQMGLKAKQKSTDFKPEVIMPKWDELFKNLKNAN